MELPVLFLSRDIDIAPLPKWKQFVYKHPQLVGERDYYSVIFVSCLSCDYYVEFIEQGGKCCRAMSSLLASMCFVLMSFSANLAELA